MTPRPDDIAAIRRALVLAQYHVDSMKGYADRFSAEDMGRWRVEAAKAQIEVDAATAALARLEGLTEEAVAQVLFAAWGASGTDTPGPLTRGKRAAMARAVLALLRGETTA